ncbi:MAG: DUF2306 domain-containing protein [Leptospira sp.]|nr:DUF2306 domain-containing protein [Leptospira sp.]
MDQKRIPKKEILWITGLLLFNVVPFLGGAIRILDIFGGVEISPENERFMAMPIPIFLHIISSLLFGILGSFQFLPHIRKYHHSWHRKAGKVIAISGLISALTGLWMTIVYPAAKNDGPTLFYVRLFIAPAMAVCLLMAIFALAKKNFHEHGDWMVRAYALALGAGTQVFTHIGFMLIIGIPAGPSRDAMMALGWLINIVFAEFWIMHRRGNKNSSALNFNESLDVPHC